MSVKLAFFKGKGNWKDRLIRLWTLGPYSHVEVVIDDVWFAATPDHGVRFLINPFYDSTAWDFVEVETTEMGKVLMRNWCMSELGHHYDWTGLVLSQIFGLRRATDEDWFCSEYAVAALQQADFMLTRAPCRFSPNKLAKYAARHPLKVA